MLEKLVIYILITPLLAILVGCNSGQDLKLIDNSNSDNIENNPSVPGDDGDSDGDENPGDDDPVGSLDCPLHYVKIAANVDLGVNEFCVAKYEMKVLANDNTPVFDGYNGGVALDMDLYKPDSRPDGIPWIRITPEQARSECASLGDRFYLTTLVEWQAIAKEVEEIGANWSTGVVGTGQLYSGHSDGAISATAVADGYAVSGTLSLSAGDGTDPFIGTGQNSTMTFEDGGRQKRTFILKSNEVIWDLSGNVREIVDIDGLGGSIDYTGPGSSGYHELNSTTFSDMLATVTNSNGIPINPAWFMPSSAAWIHNDNNIGRVYIAPNSRTERTVTRGGNFSSGNSPGLFAADFDMLITGTGSSGGFRCAFSLD